MGKLRRKQPRIEESLEESVRMHRGIARSTESNPAASCTVSDKVVCSQACPIRRLPPALPPRGQPTTRDSRHRTRLFPHLTALSTICANARR